MGCCSSGRVDGVDLEVALQGTDLAIKERKPVHDSEGDVSVSSYRGSEVLRTDSQPVFLVHKELMKDRQLSTGVWLDDSEVIQSIVTPRFGGDQKPNSLSRDLEGARYNRKLDLD